MTLLQDWPAAGLFALAAALLLLPFLIGILAGMREIVRIGTPGDPRKRISGKAWVIDGDTIVIDGKRIRLRHIDAPERGQPLKRCRLPLPLLDAGALARRHLSRLVGDQPVEAFISGKDAYGRFLADVYQLGGYELSYAMVVEGYAFADPRGPWRYRFAEWRARCHRRGLWAHCGTLEIPADWRARHPARHL